MLVPPTEWSAHALRATFCDETVGYIDLGIISSMRLVRYQAQVRHLRTKSWKHVNESNKGDTSKHQTSLVGP